MALKIRGWKPLPHYIFDGGSGILPRYSDIWRFCEGILIREANDEQAHLDCRHR
jgi:hypothetical protein